MMVIDIIGKGKGKVLLEMLEILPRCRIAGLEELRAKCCKL